MFFFAASRTETGSTLPYTTGCCVGFVQATVSGGKKHTSLLLNPQRYSGALKDPGWGGGERNSGSPGFPPARVRDNCSPPPPPPTEGGEGSAPGRNTSSLHFLQCRGILAALPASDSPPPHLLPLLSARTGPEKGKTLTSGPRSLNRRGWRTLTGFLPAAHWGPEAAPVGRPGRALPGGPPR